MKTFLIASLVAMAIYMSAVSAQRDPTCDDSTNIPVKECGEYTEEGAIFVSFDGKKEPLTDEETEMFKIIIANTTNDYVLLEVLPEHVIIVQRGYDGDTGDFTFYFFIINPSGSTYMPVALRRQELYLMVKLNNDDIGTYLAMEVTAQAPPSTYPLAIPAWAIAILGYVGLVVLIYCVMVLTSDWRQRKMADFEASLEKQYYENTNGVSAGDGIPMKKMPGEATAGNNYEVVMETKGNGALSNKTSVGVQTPRHVAVQVSPDDIGFSKTTTAVPANGTTVKAVIENGYSTIDETTPPPSPAAADDHGPSYDTTPIVSSGADEQDGYDAAGREAEDAAAAIEGAVNEGFSTDEQDQPPPPSTNL